MADHVRKRIRDDIKTTITGLTTTGSSVFVARTTELITTDYPALLIDIFTEESAAESIDEPRNLVRSLEQTIFAVEEHGTGFENTLDTICKEVEAAIAADTTLGGLAKDARLTSTTLEMKRDVEEPILAIGTQNVGVMTMVWTVEYSTPEDAADTVA